MQGEVRFEELHVWRSEEGYILSIWPRRPWRFAKSSNPMIQHAVSCTARLPFNAARFSHAASPTLPRGIPRQISTRIRTLAVTLCHTYSPLRRRHLRGALRL